MELNDNTLNVLKNFSTINQNLLVKQGNTVKTVSEAKNILSTAILDQEFPNDFGIYDLNEFIGVTGLVDTAHLKFDEDFVTVSDSTGRSKIKYFFAPEETLTTPTKDITMPECEVKFSLDNETLNKVRRAASTLGHSEVSIKPDNGTLTLSVADTQNSTANTYSIDVNGEFSGDFNFVLSIANLKIIPGDYDVSISSKLIAEFAHKEMNVRYCIALEKTSTYSGV